MSPVEFTPIDTNFPVPSFDKLGLAADALVVASTETETGQEFVLVHTRPFAGEALNYFLNNCSASSYSSTSRKHAQSTIKPLSVRRLSTQASADDRNFIKHEARLHQQGGKFGIGNTMRAFERDVRQDWQDAFDDPLTDSVYYPLFRTQVYADLSEAAGWQVGEWKAQMPNKPSWWGAEAVHKVLMHVAPTDKLEALSKSYWNNRHLAWEQREQEPEGTQKAYEKFGQELSDYIDRLPQDVRDDIIGRAYSQLPGARQGSANHTLARRLIVDLAGQRHWIEMPYVYNTKPGATDELLFPEPEIEFVDCTVRLSDDNGTSVKLKVHSNDDATAPVKWSIDSYSLPATHYTSGRYPSVAWHVDRLGERVFYDQAATVRAAHEAGLPIQGTPDSYLGKLMIKYFGQEDEYQPSEPEMKWMTRMGLPGTNEKRDITIRELPVWIQLPQHQPDLLNSRFIKASEVVAA